MAEIKLTYYSDVKEGKLQKNVSEKIASELKCFEGKRIEITVQKLRSKRSVQQNRLYWLYATILSNEIGYSKEETHEILKFKFLKREKVDEASGQVLEYLKSTAELTKAEFADLISQTIQFAAENFNIVLPLPQEQTEIF